MSLKLKPISDQVIVITGASSGIGLATALAAAKKGAKLVLASRNDGALKDIVRRITEDGGKAISVTADVGSSEQVAEIAATAVAHYGGFDTWVNDAGIGILGTLEEVSEADKRRLFDTNFWGVVNGSLIAAEHLKKSGGAIINLGSMLSDVGIPLQGMYCASKHAVKGFTDTLRSELRTEKAPVSVTLIKPAAIGTPFFEHAKNYTGHEPKAPGTVYAPEEVAHAILHAAAHPVRDIYVGSQGRITSGLKSAAPGLVDWLSGLMGAAQISPEPQKAHNDNLHQAGNDGRVAGRIAHSRRPSLYTRSAGLHPTLTGAVVTGLGMAALAAISGYPSKRQISKMSHRVEKRLRSF